MLPARVFPVSELDRTVEYTYDSLYHLTSETITEGEKTTVYTYAYDNVSNRILKTENGVETAYVYNALNQLVSDSETSYEGCDILNGVVLYVQVTPFYVGDNGVPLFINMIAVGLNGTFNLNVAVPNTK